MVTPIKVNTENSRDGIEYNLSFRGISPSFYNDAPFSLVLQRNHEWVAVSNYIPIFGLADAF